MGKVRSFQDLDIYRLAFDLAVKIDQMSKDLPRHEMYEVGSQIRRSAKSIPANIAEGFGRRRYKQDYIRFIVYALASCDETRVHLDMLNQTGSMPDPNHQHLSEAYDVLGKKVNRFLQSIIQYHKEPYR
jgi:four helix bundle protein